MTAKDHTRVFLVPGRFVTGIPAIETVCDTRKEAEALVASGAFTFDPPATPESAGAPTAAEADAAPEEA